MLQWYLGALAMALAHLSVASGYQFDLSPTQLSMGLSSPGGYVDRVAVQPGAWRQEPRLSVRRAYAERQYRAHATAFARTFDPGVKMSSKHRDGSVQDAWAIAWGHAASTVLGHAEPDRWRDSCCFIYALPGAHECARCPRLRPAPGGSA